MVIPSDTYQDGPFTITAQFRGGITVVLPKNYALEGAAIPLPANDRSYRFLVTLADRWGMIWKTLTVDLTKAREVADIEMPWIVWQPGVLTTRAEWYGSRNSWSS